MRTHVTNKIKLYESITKSNDLLPLIFIFCDRKSLLDCTLVCVFWNKEIQKDRIWTYEIKKYLFDKYKITRWIYQVSDTYFNSPTPNPAISCWEACILRPRRLREIKDLQLKLKQIDDELGTLETLESKILPFIQ